MNVLTGDTETGYTEDYEELERFEIECGAKDDKREDKEILTTFDVDANGILRVFAKSKVAQHELHVGHTMYRPRTQEEINEAAQLLQERGAAKPTTTVKVDLTSLPEVEAEVMKLIHDDMYSEAKALLREALEFVQTKLAKAPRAADTEELQAMVRWLEWKLFQHAYLFDQEQLGDGDSDLKKRRGSSGICKEEVLTDATRQNEFARMVERKVFGRRKVDNEWWAQWLGLDSAAACTPRALRRAWLAKSRDFHPDKQSACQGGDLRKGECGCYSQIMLRVHAAYDVLRPVCERNAAA